MDGVFRVALSDNLFHGNVLISCEKESPATTSGRPSECTSGFPGPCGHLALRMCSLDTFVNMKHLILIKTLIRMIQCLCMIRIDADLELALKSLSQ
jgi:hypothetical protein